MASDIRNAFSVDVEEYFQVHNFEARIQRSEWATRESRLRAGMDRLLALLDTHGVKGTFFVLTWSAERIREVVKQIHALGHEIASHGCEHRLVYSQTPAEFRDDVLRSKRMLEDWTGERVLGYRAPSYSIRADNVWAFAELAAAGFVYDSSVYPMRRKRYGIPDAPRYPHRRAEGLAEFPLPTWRLFGVNVPAAAGAYLRLLPTAVSVRAIRQLNAAGHPAVANVHPWELDPEQPRVGGGQFGGVTHYANLHQTERRLSALLRRFTFGTVRGVLDRAGLIDAPPTDALGSSA